MIQKGRHTTSMFVGRDEYSLVRDAGTEAMRGG
jgi:hypothetical protein